MSFEQRKLECDTYFIERIYKTFFRFTKIYYIRERETSDNIFFTTVPLFQIIKKIYVYSDEQKQHKYFSLIQDKFNLIYPRYVIKDNQEIPIGYIKGSFSRLRNVWEIIDRQGIKIGSLREDLKDNIFGLSRFSFTHYFYLSFFLQDREVGDIEIEARLWSRSRKFILDLTRDTERKIDRRVALALMFLVDQEMFAEFWTS